MSIKGTWPVVIRTSPHHISYMYIARTNYISQVSLFRHITSNSYLLSSEYPYDITVLICQYIFINIYIFNIYIYSIYTNHGYCTVLEHRLYSTSVPNPYRPFNYSSCSQHYKLQTRYTGLEGKRESELRDKLFIVHSAMLVDYWLQ